MSKADITVIGGNTVTPVLPFKVDDRTTSSAAGVINPGEPVKQSNANYALLVATGDPEQGTDALIGIAENESTETASAEGEVNVAVIVPFVTRLRGKATTAANIDTAAELLDVLQDAVTFDVTAGVVTVDEDETDDPNVHGLVLVDGDTAKGTLDFYAKPLATLFGNAL